jgi:polyisoprenoid-binding protein YceI
MTTLKALLLILTLPAAAQAAPDRVWLNGDSTLHAFSSTATIVNIQAVFAKGLPGTLEVEIPLSGLKSHSAGLDKNMRKALKEEKTPVLRFELTRYDAGAERPGPFAIKAEGKLTIAGVTRETVLEAAGQVEKDGLHVIGTKELLMTDFGIAPPTMMMGTIKTADRIVVGFDVTLKENKEN